MSAHVPALASALDSPLAPARTRSTPAAPAALAVLAASTPLTCDPGPGHGNDLPDLSPFDLVHDRTGTGSLKWDFAAERGRPTTALPLWVADMDHATAPCVTSALLWRVRHGIFGYSEPDADYNTALAGWFSRRYDWRIDPAWNVITPGVVPALALAVRALTGPGDAVVIEEPVYYPFREVVEANGRTVVSVPLIRDADGAYRRDAAALEAALARTGARLLLLCNPHNPVGRVWSRDELTELALANARFEIAVTEGQPAAHGADVVEFLLASHPGAPLRPIGASASGGELSRVMLAVEVSLAERAAQSDRTFLFDEVDAGVGGRAAQAVGRRLAKLAEKHQVIVVTHLAQVAAHAATQAVVVKEEDESGAKTDVAIVAGDERLGELARMLSGSDTDAARAHAAELLGGGSDVAR